MRVFGILMSGVLACFFFWNLSSAPTPPEKDRLLLEILNYVLERGHYDPKVIDDAFSENAFQSYLDGLDGQHRFFLQTDINTFKRYRYRIDDEFKASALNFFNVTYERLLSRMTQVENFYPQLLEAPFDFSKPDQISLDYENLPYANSVTQLKSRWRKRLKLSVLDRFSDNKKEEKEKFESDSTYVMKSDVELEKEARKLTLENTRDYFDLVKDLDRKDWFSVYINAIVMQFDPHTFYFAPEEKDRFDTSMSGKFEGIGARLQKRNQEVKIVEVISGGPIWRGKLLDVGDIILKVAQKDEDPVEIVGMRLEDAIKLIKGPKGTEVRLTVKRVDGTIEVIPIVRDIVELEEVYARSTIIEKEGKKFGLINLPKFYIDFKDYGERNAAIDVKKELEQLKAKNVSGIVLDLRNNGGGSLKTVVDMTGYFIDEGPVVQVKSTGGRKEILKDTDPGMVWDGPLVVLVNEFSASASEIIAAALQDYNRAIILGSKQTFGKGTVQNVVDLNRIISGNTYGDLGALKVTTDKFYRITGESTQLEGVKSDVVFPDRYQFIDMGEKDQENPLAWDNITPASYTPWKDPFNYDFVVKQSQYRIQENSFASIIEKQARWVAEQQEDYNYFLDYPSFSKEQKESFDASKQFDVLKDFDSNLNFKWLPEAGMTKAANDDYIEKRDRWVESLDKDLYVNEAISILNDMSLSLKGDRVSQNKN